MFLPNGPISNIPVLVRIMAWRRQATSHYLNQWWLDYRRIYVSFGLNELTLIGSLEMYLVLSYEMYLVLSYEMYLVLSYEMYLVLSYEMYLVLSYCLIWRNTGMKNNTWSKMNYCISLYHTCIGSICPNAPCLPMRDTVYNKWFDIAKSNELTFLQRCVPENSKGYTFSTKFFPDKYMTKV